VWLLNRTPADQLSTQVPEPVFEDSIEQPLFGGEIDGSVQDGDLFAQIEEPVFDDNIGKVAQAQDELQPQQQVQLNQQSPQQLPTINNQIEDVPTTAPTGAGELYLAFAALAVLLGSGGFLYFFRFERFGS